MDTFPATGMEMVLSESNLLHLSVICSLAIYVKIKYLHVPMPFETKGAERKRNTGMAHLRIGT